MSIESIAETPTLSQSHSGIPSRLLSKARKAKALIYSGRTDARATSGRLPQLPVIPQGVSRLTFDKAIAELSSQLGSDHVEIIDKLPQDEGWYMEHPNTHDMMTVTPTEAFLASAVVYPGSTSEVQTIVQWANKYTIPLFPISMGRNLGYGGAAPRVKGSVVVDLGRRMNKILNIDPDDYTCLVEPGVSFYALYEEVQKRGHGDKVWIDTPDLGGGSVLGNTLDRGVGYTPYGDHWAMHSGLEVVMPTGEVIRTGMGALPGNNTWQTFPYGFGPYIDGLFSQSNLGIVTKLGMTLMSAPPDYESFMYTFDKEEDLAQAIEIIRPLRIANILENAAQLRSAKQALAVTGQPKTDFYSKSGPMPTSVVDEQTAAKLPTAKFAWSYYGMAYGPAHIRKYKLDIIHAEFMKVPGARKIDPSTLPKNNYFWSRDKIARGETDLEELLWVNWVPNGSHIAFSPVSPIRGKDATALFDLCKKWQAVANMDFFPAFIVGLREMHLIVEIIFDKHDPASCEGAMKGMRGMVEDAAKMGYGEYRTHLALMDQVAGTYSWNDNALMKLNEKIKDSLDPKGVLAPGKSGVWPARYRGRNWEMKTGKESSEGDGVAATEPEMKL